MGFLSHWLADSGEHADQCTSAFAERLPRVVVEGLRVFSGSDTRGGADGGFAGAPGGVAAGATGCRVGTGGFLDGDLDGTLSHLVCAEHSGTRGYLCRGLHAVGPGVCTARPRSETPGRGFVVYGGGAMQGDRDSGSA